MDNQFTAGNTIVISRPIASVVAFRFLFRMFTGEWINPLAPLHLQCLSLSSLHAGSN